MENCILSFFMHAISHNMKNVHKIGEKICKKNIYFPEIQLKYVGSIIKKRICPHLMSKISSLNFLLFFFGSYPLMIYITLFQIESHQLWLCSYQWNNGEIVWFLTFSCILLYKHIVINLSIYSPTFLNSHKFATGWCLPKIL